MRIVEALHREFPELTYDATIKIEHLLKHRDLVPRSERDRLPVRDQRRWNRSTTRCWRSWKKATRAPIFWRSSETYRAAGLPLAPPLFPSRPGPRANPTATSCALLLDLDLVDNVAPIQLALRLLIPDGSRLLELPRSAPGHRFDEPALLHRWRHPDPWLDELRRAADHTVQRAPPKPAAPSIFRKIWNLAGCGAFPDVPWLPRATIPYMDEPWYC